MPARSVPTRSPGSGNGAASTRTSPARSWNCIRVGVRSVYTQEDVTRFANVITGWTVIGFRQDPARAGEFVFNPNMHQPGPQKVIGKTYPDTGFEQGRAVLATLARHPATAKHVATKLARHFVADEPPPALVERLARRFLDTQGDLKEVARTLVTSDEAWSAPRAKLKRPGEWIIGALRATGVTPHEIGPVMRRAQPAGRTALAAAGAEGLLRRQRGLARRPGAAYRRRQPDGAAHRRHRSTPRVCSKSRWRRSPRPRRGRRLRAPRAGSRRWRCC